MKRPSFSRTILPIIAVIGIIGSIVYLMTSQPDMSLSNPKENSGANAAIAAPDRQHCRHGCHGAIK